MFSLPSYFRQSSLFCFENKRLFEGAPTQELPPSQALPNLETSLKRLNIHEEFNAAKDPNSLSNLATLQHKLADAEKKIKMEGKTYTAELQGKFKTLQDTIKTLHTDFQALRKASELIQDLASMIPQQTENSFAAPLKIKVDTSQKEILSGLKFDPTDPEDASGKKLAESLSKALESKTDNKQKIAEALAQSGMEKKGDALASIDKLGNIVEGRIALWKLFVAEDGKVNLHIPQFENRVGLGEFALPYMETISRTRNGKEIIAKRKVTGRIHYGNENMSYVNVFSGDIIKGVDNTGKSSTVAYNFNKDSFQSWQEILNADMKTRQEYIKGHYKPEDFSSLEGYKDALDTGLIPKEMFAREQGGMSIAAYNEVRDAITGEVIKKGDVQINQDKISQLQEVMARIWTHKERYQKVADTIQQKVGMAYNPIPWQLIAALHYRESSNNFSTYLHNGDPLGAPTVHVPVGKFFRADEWEEAAVDAILSERRGGELPGDDFNKMMVFAEKFNGLGYQARNMNSPYVWAGTNKQQKGMYIADHVFSANAEDKRLGVASIVMGLEKMEKKT